MKLAVHSMNTDRDVAPGRLAPLVAERGFDSIWFGEHTHMPVSRRSPYPPGGELPEDYRRMMDPLVALSFAAAAAPGLGLGTAVCLALQRDPIILAKEIATLDRLSAGRVTLGVGVGWNREELAAHRALDWPQRYNVLCEVVGALRSLWSDEVSGYAGDHVVIEATWSLPKPIQPGGPRIAMGSRGPVGIRHAAQWADVWMPVGFGVESIEGLLATFEHELAVAERTKAAVAVQVLCADNPDGADLRRYHDLGVELVVVGPGFAPTGPRTDIEHYLDYYAGLAEQLG